MNNKSFGYGSGMSASYSTTQTTNQSTNPSPSKPSGTQGFERPAAKPAQTGPLIKDTTTQDFMADVIEASKSTTVLVDFWAPWCGPCKQLTPILEKAVTDAKGRVKLVKLNIDDHPAIPGQMGIQSVPAVVAFKDGRPIDGFMGAQPESQIKAFIDKNGSEPQADPLDAACEQAAVLLEEGKAEEALQIYSAILQQAQTHMPAIIGVASAFLAMGEVERARDVFQSLPEEAMKEQAVVALKASLELAEQSADLGELGELQAQAGNRSGQYSGAI